MLRSSNERVFQRFLEKISMNIITHTLFLESSTQIRYVTPLLVSAESTIAKIFKLSQKAQSARWGDSMCLAKTWDGIHKNNQENKSTNLRLT